MLRNSNWADDDLNGTRRYDIKVEEPLGGGGRRMSDATAVQSYSACKSSYNAPLATTGFNPSPIQCAVLGSSPCLLDVLRRTQGVVQSVLNA